MISHDEIQAALSARLDGEQVLIDDAVVDAHLTQCPECQQYWERSVQLSRQLGAADVGRELTAPDLSEVILAGVADPRREAAQRRLVMLTIARVGLALMAVVWALWAVQLVTGADAADPVLASAAAVRFGVALGLGLCVWRPGQVPGVLLIVGTMFTFTVGFWVRDAVLGVGEFPASLVAVPLVTTLALVWTWVADRGIELRRAWALLSADPS